MAAVGVDAPVARWVRSSGLATAVKGTWWADHVLKVPGQFYFTAVVVALLWALRRIDWRGAVFVLAVAAFAGLNGVVKWVVGRVRPYRLPASFGPRPRPLVLQPFWHGWHGLFYQVDLSFPSGHVCTAFALAAAVLVVCRPAGWVLVGLAAVVAMERVAENAHYVSDVVGAVGFASVGTWMATATGLHRTSPRARRGFEPVVPGGPQP